MDYKYACVVDNAGRYKTIVLILLEPDMEGKIQEKVQYYTLAEGESMVETTAPAMRPYAGAAGFVRPMWDEDGATWAEGATHEEIAAWEAEHPAPKYPEPVPDVTSRVAALEQDKADKTEVEAITAAIERGLSL